MSETISKKAADFDDEFVAFIQERLPTFTEKEKLEAGNMVFYRLMLGQIQHMLNQEWSEEKIHEHFNEKIALCLLKLGKKQPH